MINSPADFDQIRADPGGNYCLGRDIDMGRVKNFQPMTLDGSLMAGAISSEISL
jgi:hypothetical protein